MNTSYFKRYHLPHFKPSVFVYMYYKITRNSFKIWQLFFRKQSWLVGCVLRPTDSKVI